MKINQNKKAISLMLSYVILIAITIGLSAGVYVWLKDYANVSPKIDCKDGTSVRLEDYNFNEGVMNLTLKNNGYFNVSGVLVTVNNVSGRMPIYLLVPNIPAKSGITPVKGYYEFASQLKPGDIDYAKFLIEGFGEIKVVQIQPYIKDEKDNKIMCEQVVIRREL